MKKITRTIWLLSFISLFADIASEMLYPVMPLYLTSIQFSTISIGILEGFAEALAGLSKGYFGKLSDTTGKRAPFIKWGYALSSISKPMMALFTYPTWIFLSRSLDRFGKGLRTGARDAMLSDEATGETKGRIFGFHRSMDTLGAAIGPVLALLYLYTHPADYKTLFIIAIVPGIITIALSAFIRDKHKKTAENKPASFLSFLKYWKQATPMYRKVVAGLLLFTLFNSSDVFLLLQVKHAGLDDTYTIGIYIFYNIIYAAFAYPIGILADRIGLKYMLIAGYLLFAVVYTMMSVNTNTIGFIAIFFAYGLYAAATEGISKAWITNIAGRHDKATAIGTFTAFQSICTLIASSLTGFLWYYYGSFVALLITGIASACIAVYFLLLKAGKVN